VSLARFLTSEDAQRRIAASGALWPTRMRLYAEADLVARQPAMPAILALALAARPRPVTPYYLMLSTNLQPELSAALVGVKTPAQSVRDTRRRLAYLLGTVARAAR